MQKWEYKILYLAGRGIIYDDGEEVDEEVDEDEWVWPYLAKLGMAGWELVSTTPFYEDMSAHFLYFKRPKE